MEFSKSLPFKSWKNRRVTVMGLGRFGGGVAVTRFLVQRGAVVTLTDLASEAELAESLEALKPFLPARLVLGRHEERDFRDTDCLVVNPAVKPDNPFLKLAADAGVPLTSEMNLFWQSHRGRSIAVTGSNGKSTTAAMIHAMLSQAGFRSRLGGNIGRSLLDEVDDIQDHDWTVLELSSFQLERLNSIRPRPDVAVMTNFTPNHLDWHGSLANYRKAKQTVLRNQTAEDTTILNADDPEVSRWATAARRLGFGEHTEDGEQGEGIFAVSPASSRWRIRVGEIDQTIPLGDWLSVPGRHNQQNAAAALLAALCVGVSFDEAKTGLQKFSGLPHRLEFVIETAGRRFYNDSIATTPESVERALTAFSEPIILLVGGSDKGIDLTPLTKQIARRVKAAALLGETGPMLQRDLQDRGVVGDAFRVCRSLEEAVRWAGERSQRGDVILLSPGCASYDWFRNFAERGEQFARLAKSWQPLKAETSD